MTTAELIDRLKSFPREAEVQRINGTPVTIAYYDGSEKKVFIN